MKILALEFSSSHRSVAVAEASSKGAAVLATAQESGGRETNPLRMIETALAQAKLPRESIECLAVGVGPGSYTGIRVAISVAQGWQLAREVKLLAISSAECLAHDAWQQGLSDKVHIGIDAQRNEFYLAAYNLDSAGAKVVERLHLVGAADVERLISSGQKVLGPDLSGFFPQAHDLWPQAATVAILAAGRSEFLRGEQLEPIYLREAAFLKAPPPRILPGEP